MICAARRGTVVPDMDGFVASSIYSAPVDIKKLRFIFAVIQAFLRESDRIAEQIRVMEIGCGSGGIALSLASLGTDVTAIDVDPAKVAAVRQLANERSLHNLDVRAGDGCCSSSDGEIYDVIVISEVLQYVLEAERLIENMGGRLSADGCIIATIPNGYGPWEIKNRLSPVQRLGVYRWNWLRRMLGKGSYVENIGEVLYRYYSRDEFADLFAKCGFRLTAFGKSNSIFAAIPFVNRSTCIAKADNWLADHLPYRLASGWYFVFQRR